MSDKIPAGRCPNCGVVADEAVNWNFPNAATCANCETELEVAGMATPEQLANFA